MMKRLTSLKRFPIEFKEPPYRKCPSYPKCSANLCPLDPLLYKRVGIKTEPTCKADKFTVKRIAKEYGFLIPPSVWRKVL